MKLRIANKRLISESDKAYVFSTSGYGKRIFTIPKSQLIGEPAPSSIEVNDVTSYEAMDYVIPLWLYNKIEGDLLVMSDKHINIMPNSGI